MNDCVNNYSGCHMPAPPMGGNIFISEQGKLYLRNSETKLWHYVSLGLFQGVHTISVEAKGVEDPNCTLKYHSKGKTPGEAIYPIKAVEAFFSQDGDLYMKSKFTGDFFLIAVSGADNALQLTVSGI